MAKQRVLYNKLEIISNNILNNRGNLEGGRKSIEIQL